MTRRRTLTAADQEIFSQPEVTERKSMVPAFSGVVPYYGVTQEGKKKLLGRLGYTDYDRERRQRTLMFEVPGEDGHEPSRYSLGTGHGNSMIVDQAMVVMPLLKMGFQMRTAPQSLRGGARAFVALTHPKLQYKDVINWDAAQFPDGEKNNNLLFSIGVWTDARASGGAKMIGGFFRVLCANGLIAEVLGLGKLRVSHKNWSVERIQHWATETTRVAGEGNPANFARTSTRALGWVVDGLHMSVQNPEAIRELPNLAQNPLRQLERCIPDGVRLGIAEQMSQLMKKEKTFSALDLLNAITNAARGSHSAGLSIRQERVVASVLEMAELGAFRANVPYQRTQAWA